MRISLCRHEKDSPVSPVSSSISPPALSDTPCPHSTVAVFKLPSNHVRSSTIPHLKQARQGSSQPTSLKKFVSSPNCQRSHHSPENRPHHSSQWECIYRIWARENCMFRVRRYEIQPSQEIATLTSSTAMDPARKPLHTRQKGHSTWN